MRILSVGNMYPPHHQGGYEIVWQATMAAARERGHEVRILVSEHREPQVSSQDEEHVHRTLRWYWSWDDYEFPELGLRGRVAIERANARELGRHLDEFQPDVVSWWSMGSMSLSMIEQVRQRGLPATFAVHDDWLVYGRKFDQWTRIWRGRRRLAAPLAEGLLRIPTTVDVPRAGPLVFNSRYTLERARDAGIDVTRAEIIHPGIAGRFLDPAAEQPWGWRLLCVGRLDRQKGTDTAVEALRELPEEATLAIFGTGDPGYLDELHSLARDRGVEERVTFAGFAPPEQLWHAYAAADVVVFPVRWEEPFGLVPLEAMGVGRPVVSTAQGGSREFLEDGRNALIVKPNDAPGLAAAVRRLATDPELRRRMGHAGRQTAAANSADAFANRMVDQIERSA